MWLALHQKSPHSLAVSLEMHHLLWIGLDAVVVGRLHISPGTSQTIMSVPSMSSRLRKEGELRTSLSLPRSMPLDSEAAGIFAAVILRADPE